ncbi:hypothetical protein BJY04DRAFT_201480 [Aspergillus karnatakaensis]|uniref:uncharacterized protein n=1 Tax=Aspergillus karnatakaensis TaxID=1810916 RepID=UPI003CCC9277
MRASWRFSGLGLTIYGDMCVRRSSTVCLLCLPSRSKHNTNIPTDGDIIYCRACPSYRTALPVSSSPTTSEPQIDPATCLTKHTVTTTAPRFLGRIIMPIIVSRHLLAKCLEPGTTNFNIARAYKVLGECFNMLDLRSIKVPQADMVANLVRDSLFVDVSAGIGGQGTQRVDGARQIASWGRFFNISESDVPRDQGFTCGRGRGSISGKGAGSGSGTVATAKGSVGVAVGAGIASVASLISG